VADALLGIVNIDLLLLLRLLAHRCDLIQGPYALYNNIIIAVYTHTCEWEATGKEEASKIRCDGC
jgi:hypothetical protein